MQHEDIEKYFREGKLEEFLAIYEEMFEKIEEHQRSMREGRLDNPHDINTVMTELTGIYMTLNFITIIIKSILEQRESRLFEELMSHRGEFDKAPNPTIIKKEAMARTKDERRIHKIFDAYSKSCDKAIYTLQSSLKNMFKERMLTR